MPSFVSDFRTLVAVEICLSQHDHKGEKRINGDELSHRAIYFCFNSILEKAHFVTLKVASVAFVWFAINDLTTLSRI
jgi:hypothetical protein